MASMKVDRKWCPHCNDFVKAEKHGASHLFHLFMSCITAGFWLIVWYFVGTGKRFHCSTCGAETRNRQPAQRTVNTSAARRAAFKKDEKHVYVAIGVMLAGTLVAAIWMFANPVPPYEPSARDMATPIAVVRDSPSVDAKEIGRTTNGEMIREPLERADAVRVK